MCICCYIDMIISLFFFIKKKQNIACSFFNSFKFYICILLCVVYSLIFILCWLDFCANVVLEFRAGFGLAIRALCVPKSNPQVGPPDHTRLFLWDTMCGKGAGLKSFDGSGPA